MTHLQMKLFKKEANCKVEIHWNFRNKWYQNFQSLPQIEIFWWMSWYPSWILTYILIGSSQILVQGLHVSDPWKQFENTRSTLEVIQLRLPQHSPHPGKIHGCPLQELYWQTFLYSHSSCPICLLSLYEQITSGIVYCPLLCWQYDLPNTDPTHGNWDVHSDASIPHVNNECR